ncbi:xanthine dehydrogenase family protein molybdopterin-binding subunit [Aquicoccus porphyridii]|uniref:Xanthine dehydrogenase family protein molybdopterin-binding subunit n=1 Tax=Aquicoccus porphyridii TaxID=1852029 RepID=A0A5A9ZC51_9RHOB|nr:molybdopterin cofactor-binding domain-containing protein [Aquicoccus porphyridii]KAA0914649.1 xanthine dehydrogenase family protein molybdopterin-binding subunit [Aquicoccus porphyridii]RAI53267.1 xanthine dehydrogenase family protein molybdopterin-binding subunit [Rhodobacteraceae bacterium AsT-22]
MGKVGKIARRTFLIGSAAVLGGVAFGYVMYKRPAKNPLLDGLGEGEAALTPYVLINAEGVTLITPRGDKGQGAYHVQAALIAEELDVDLDKIKVDPGPPDAAYYNTALSAEAVPFAYYDEGVMAETLRDVMDAPMKFLGMQITGGSTTVPDAWEKLRVAGAVARETLKAAAAEVSGINVTALETGEGRVILPDGSALTYEELAPVAAGLKPVNKVRLRAPEEWRYIGKPMKRIDIAAKSTGTQDYGIDVELPDMVHAAVRLNPRRGGALNGFDAQEARGMRGVEAVFEIPGGVAVLADNTWRAFRAAETVECDWGPADYPDEQAEHWQALAESFVSDRQDSRQRDEGDVEAALGDAPIEAEYRAPYLAHAPLEPINATVWVQEGRVDVWTGTQVPRFAQSHVAEICGVKADQVHVHVLMMGGSFGHRLEDDVVIRAAQIAMQAGGRPVKLTYSREEDTRQDFLRPAGMARMKGAVGNGQVRALDLHVAAPSIMASQMGERQGLPMPGPDMTIAQAAWDQAYAIPDYRVTGYRAPRLAPVSSWRSVGASINGFFHEGFLDELIHAAGADPLEERLRMCFHEPTRKALEAVGEMASWSGPRPEEGVGRGVALVTSFGVPCAEIVEVRMTELGLRIERVWVAAEVGRVVDPVNFDGLVKGGVVFGLGHAMLGEITFADGRVEQENYDLFEAMRIDQCPEIEVRGLENGDKVLGIGEPPVPPAAPALANAIFAATGQRLREMPFSKFVDFA